MALTVATAMKPSRSRIVVLLNEDGVSLTATILSSSSFNNDADRDEASTIEEIDDDDTSHQQEQGIILTIAMNRHDEKNVINPRMISLLTQALDMIDSHPLVANANNKALIITGLSPVDEGNSSKFFSNGLDLSWMLQAASSDNDNIVSNQRFSPTSERNNDDNGTNNNNHISKMIEAFNAQVLARILTLPFCTIAAINGHCIGAGLFLALACDYRIMRTERGYLQWPEARLGMRVTKGFMELSKAKVRADNVLREGILSAKKYSPNEALASGLVDAIYPVEELYNRAFQSAVARLPTSSTGMNLEYFEPKEYSVIKIEMYTDAYRALMFGKVDDLPHSKI